MSKPSPKQQQASPHQVQSSPGVQSTPASPTSTTSPMDHSKSNQVIHVRGDSDSHLEELFNAVMNPSGSLVPLTLPMRQRKFPASFFNPPDKGSRTPASHSRESSTDSTATSVFGSSNNNSNNNNGNSSASPNQSSLNSLCSKVSTQLLQQQQQQQQQENGSGSVSGASGNNSTSQQAGGGAGSGQNGQQHPSGLVIHHPRAHSSPASLQQTFASASNIQHQHLRQQSYDIIDEPPLPPGWGMAKTPTGQRYYLNHITQTTTWEDPRKKQPLSNSSAVSLGHLASGGSSASSTPTPSPTPAINPLSIQNLGPLPDGLEQATTPEGEVYFINHITRTTITNSNSEGQFSVQQRQQQVRLQRLQMERERLQLRQREIMMQEMLMQQHLIEALPPTSPAMDLQPSLSTTGLDPFLSGSTGTPTSTDFHSRQESADSGLGMGTNYSHPHTPEGFLSPMDDSSMDTATDAAQLAAADLGNLDLGDNNNMDSDDLEPSLQVEFGNDLLDVDVQELLNTNRMDSALTWL
ncbi:hypothetical protein CHUAL_002891 [Chamberlinius hualienensis]